MDLSEIIVASIGLLASAITASLSYYFTKKHQLKREECRLKEEFYRLFIKALSDVAIDNKDDDAQKSLSEGFNSLLLMANANVVSKLMEFHNFVKMENVVIPRDSEEWTRKHDDLLTELVKEMRQDLFGKGKNINRFFPKVHLVGRKQ
ncbi:MAG: hypothetical protein KAJ66_06810 [Candidatus Omnitrophica bacterium]|nr:hypothetical protein [Candidatus Omnitrophota bacterium]